MKGMKKTGLFLLVMMFFSQGLFGLETENCGAEPENISGEGGNTRDIGPVLLNLIAPGTIQISQGKPEGWFYLPGTALLVTGMIGLNSTSMEPLGLGQPTFTIMSEVGSALFAYSFFAYYRDTFTEGAAAGAEYAQPVSGRESLPALLLSPFVPANLFSPAVFPLLAMKTCVNLDSDTLEGIREYWSLDSASLAGIDSSPAGVFGIAAAFSAAMALSTAVAEELVWRGLMREVFHDPWEALMFGAAHLGNMAVETPFTPSGTTEVILQSLHATAMGFYLDWISDLDSGMLRLPVTVHFWNNFITYLFAFMTGYSEGAYDDVGAALLCVPLSVSVRIRLD